MFKVQECGIRVLTFRIVFTANKAGFVFAALNCASVFMSNSHGSFFFCIGVMQSAERGIETSCLILCKIKFRKKGLDVPKINFLIMHEDETDSLPVDNSLW